MPQITGALAQAENVIEPYTVVLKEQYYLNGVFTEVTGDTLDFRAARGFSDVTDFIWTYDNWYRFNGLSNFIPYSGRKRITYPVFTEGPQYTQQYINIQLHPFNPVQGWFNEWFDRTALGYIGIVNIPLYEAGVTDVDGYPGVQIDISQSATPSGGTAVDTILIEANLEECVDDEVILMYQDRFFQWSYMSFSKKNIVRVDTQDIRMEGVDGRFRYNVESSDTIRLNTDWMEEGQNPLIRDVINTEKCFIVNDDGSIDEVVIDQNSLGIQTSRNDGLIQYSMNVRKSVDNFVP